MPSPISYKNWILSPSQVTAGGGDAWTNVGHAATRQLSSQAVSVLSPEADEEEGDGATNIDVDLGAVRDVGCVALLGHGFLAQPSECNVMVFGSAGTPGAADALNISTALSVSFLQRVCTPHLAWWFDRTPLRYLQFRFQGYPYQIRIGRLWAGPLWGQSVTHPALADVPTVENDWALLSEPSIQPVLSKGGQAFSGTTVRTRGLSCRFANLPHRLALGDDVDSVGWQEIQEAADDQPMLVAARVAHPDVDDRWLSHRHLVYGAQTLPMALRHSVNGGDRYSLDLAFRGEL